MKERIKQVKWDILITSALYIVLGIAAILIPETMIKTLGYLIGSVLIVAGAVSMICYLLREAHQNYYRNDFLYGLVGISIGIIVLYKMEWIVSLGPVIMGVMVLASGCRKLQDVIDMKRMGYGNWVVMLVLAAVNAVFGVVVILNPFETLVVLFQLVGAGLIFSGVSDCVITFYFAGRIKDYLDRIYAVDSTFAEVTETENKKEEKEKKKEAKEMKQEAPNGQESKTVEERAPETEIIQKEAYAVDGGEEVGGAGKNEG